MCMVCGTTGGCRSACPEYVEPEAEKIGECEICGEAIEAGEDYFDLDDFEDDKFIGGKVHYDCMCDKCLVRG